MSGLLIACSGTLYLRVGAAGESRCCDLESCCSSCGVKNKINTFSRFLEELKTVPETLNKNRISSLNFCGFCQTDVGFGILQQSY